MTTNFRNFHIHQINKNKKLNKIFIYIILFYILYIKEIILHHKFVREHKAFTLVFSILPSGLFFFYILLLIYIHIYISLSFETLLNHNILYLLLQYIILLILLWIPSWEQKKKKLFSITHTTAIKIIINNHTTI